MARRCVLCGVKKGKILSKFPKHGAKRTLWLAAVELGEENQARIQNAPKGGETVGCLPSRVLSIEGGRSLFVDLFGLLVHRGPRRLRLEYLCGCTTGPSHSAGPQSF